jgi:hypothetical protein
VANVAILADLAKRESRIIALAFGAVVASPRIKAGAQAFLRADPIALAVLIRIAWPLAVRPLIAVGALCTASTRKTLNVTFASTIHGALATPVTVHICVAKAIAVWAVQTLLALITELAFEAGRALACAISETRPMPAAIHFRNALDGEGCIVVAIHQRGKV